MASLTFFMDYFPFLMKRCKSAVAVYLFYDKFQNDEGVVQITYKDFLSHAYITSSTISEAIQLLKEFDLIELVNDPKYFGKNFYRLKPINPLVDVQREELAKKFDCKIDTTVRNKYMEPEISEEYQQLLDLVKMQKAYNDLGDIKFQIVKCLAKYFNLDLHKLNLLLETKGFFEKFKEIRSKVKADNQATERKQVTDIESNSIKDEVVIKTQDLEKEKMGKIQDLYQQFIAEGNLARGTKEELAVDKWKAPQLLWYFCILHKRKYSIDYTFTTNLYKSKEIKHMSQILETFASDALEVKEYFDWTFEIKEKQLNGINSTGILANVRMINEFKKIKVKVKKSIVGGIPPEFIEWIKQNAKTFLDFNNCKTIEDLKWAREEVIAKDANEVTQTVVQEALKRGIL